MPIRRPPFLLALASAIAMAGCPATVEQPASPFDDVLGTTTNPAPPRGSANFVGVKGQLVVSGVAAGLTVFLTDARVVEVPNAGRGTTDTGGLFTISPVPPASVWFAVAEVGGKKVAGFVVPKGPDEQGKAQVYEATITEASTLAVAGILPLFLASEADPTKLFYQLRDLAADKFEALAAAVKASGETVTLQARLGSLTTSFFQLKDKNKGVEDAYNALVTDLRNKTLVRGSGGLNDLPALGDSLGPNVKVPTPAPIPSPRPVVGASSSPGTGSSTPPTTAPTVAPVPQPTPRGATVTQLDALPVDRYVSPAQMAAYSKDLLSGILVPGGNTLTLSDLPAALKTAVGSSSLQIGVTPAVSELRAVLADPNGALWTVALFQKEGGGNEQRIARLTPVQAGLAVNAEAVATAVSGVELASVVGLAFSPFGTANAPKFLALTKTSLVEIDPSASGTNTVLWAGNTGAVGTVSGDQAASAAGYLLQDATSLAVAGNRIFFTEIGTNARRIMEYLPGPSGAQGSVRRLVGNVGAAERLDGPFTQARFAVPSSIAALSNNLLLVTDTTNHVVRRVDLSAATVESIYDVSGSLGSLVNSRLANVASVAATGGNKAYALTGARNLVSFPVP